MGKYWDLWALKYSSFAFSQWFCNIVRLLNFFSIMFQVNTFLWCVEIKGGLQASSLKYVLESKCEAVKQLFHAIVKLHTYGIHLLKTSNCSYLIFFKLPHCTCMLYPTSLICLCLLRYFTFTESLADILPFSLLSLQ